MGRNIRCRVFITVNGICLEITVDVEGEVRVKVLNELAPGERVELEVSKERGEK